MTKHIKTPNVFLSIVRTSVSIFREPLYAGLALAGAVLFLVIYIFIPIWLVPGNSLAYTLAQASFLSYLLLTVLALMTGMLLSFEVFAFRRSRTQALGKVAGEGGAGFVASLIGGVLAAASCGCGIGILLGVLGLGGATLFVIANQTLISVVMIGVVATGLYFSARRVAGVCATCHV